MALNLTQPDYRALAALAGRHTGSLGLQSPAQAGLKAAAIRQQGEQSDKDRALRLMALQQQGQLALRNNPQGLLSQGVQQQQVDPLKLAALQMAERQQQQPGQDKTVALQKAMKEEIEAAEKADPEEVKSLGALSASIKSRMDEAQTPEAKRQIQMEAVKHALNNGLITDKQAAELGRMPIPQFGQVLDMNIAKANMFGEYNKMKKAGQPDGKSSELRPTTLAMLEKDVITAQENLGSLKAFYQNIPERYFGPKAGKQAMIGFREWASGIPGLGMLKPDAEDLDDRKYFEELIARQEMFAMTLIKQLSGVQYSDKQLEFLKKILPSIGTFNNKSTFDGRVNALMSIFENIKQHKQDLRDNGFTQNSIDGDSEYGKMLLRRIQNSINPEAFRQSTEMSKEEKGFRDFHKGLPPEQLEEAISILKKQGKL